MGKVYIDGEIGWDVMPADVMDQMAMVKGKDEAIELHINSPGGSVFDGYAIMTALRSSGRPVDVYIDGLAASMASAIAMVGRKVTMSETSAMMIHSPWSVAYGNAKEMRKEADILDMLGNQLAGYYVSKSGQTLETVNAWLEAETWFDPQMALEYGFADAIFQVVEPKKKVAKAFDLSRFKHVPDKIAAMYSDESVKVRNAEKSLRDAGFSRKAAKTILSGGMTNLRDADETTDEVAEKPAKKSLISDSTFNKLMQLYGPYTNK